MSNNTDEVHSQGPRRQLGDGMSTQYLAGYRDALQRVRALVDGPLGRLAAAQREDRLPADCRVGFAVDNALTTLEEFPPDRIVMDGGLPLVREAATP